MRYSITNSITKKNDEDHWGVMVDELGVMVAESPLEAIAKFDKTLRSCGWYVTEVWTESCEDGTTRWIVTAKGQVMLGSTHYILKEIAGVSP